MPLPTYGPIPPNWKWYEAGVEQFNQFDVEKAKSLLDEAGWTEGSDGIREKAVSSSPGTHANFGDQPFNRPVVEAWSPRPGEIGVEMKSEHHELAAVRRSLTTPDNPPLLQLGVALVVAHGSAGHLRQDHPQR